MRLLEPEKKKNPRKQTKNTPTPTPWYGQAEVQCPKQFNATG